MKVVILKSLGITSLIVTSICWLFFIYLNFHYAEINPKSPIPSQGYIYPLYTEGALIYLTICQRILRISLICTTLLSVLTMFIVKLQLDKKNYHSS